MVPDDLIDKFIEKVNIITKEKKVKEFQVFTSVDTWGKDAEYIRNGLIFDKFWNNCNKFLRECPIPSLTFMVTYNALSVFNFDKFIEGVYELKSNYLNEYRICPPHSSIIDISYLRYPTHQTVKVLPRETWSLIRKQVNLMKKLQRDDKGVEYFTDMEISKLERIFDWLRSKNDRKQLLRDKKDFGIFFREHDKRRNTNFLETFPLLEKLYGG
jgi:hypothetical protein